MKLLDPDFILAQPWLLLAIWKVNQQIGEFSSLPIPLYINSAFEANNLRKSFRNFSHQRFIYYLPQNMRFFFTYCAF